MLIFNANIPQNQLNTKIISKKCFLFYTIMSVYLKPKIIQ